MFGWWRKSDGFEWREYVRTTILVRRKRRREKVDEARKAAVAGIKQAGKAGAEASASGVAKGWQAARAGGDRLAEVGLTVLSAIVRTPARLAAAATPALSPAGRALARSGFHGPALLIGGLASIAAVARWVTSGFDAPALVSLGLAVAGLMLGLVPVLTGDAKLPVRLPTAGRRIPFPAVRPAVAGGLAIAAVAAVGGYGVMRYLAPEATGSLLSSLPLPTASKPIEGRATAITADSMRVGNVIVRLAGIEAPESDQRCPSAGRKNARCAEAAVEGLTRLVRGKLVSCSLSGNDDAGRSLAACKTEGNDIAANLVKQGLVFSAQGRFARYASQESEARTAKAGIWRLGEPQRPAEWRAKRWEEAKRAAPDGCPIKGAVGNDGKVYLLPWSREYDRVRVRTGRGERWFCSEQDARAAGWRLSERS